MFDPAETVVAQGVFRGRIQERRKLLRLRRERLESAQNLVLGKLSFAMAEVMKDSFASLELILIGLGYEKFRERNGVRVPQPDDGERSPDGFTIWRD